ncbi:MAG: hypothetical protein V2A72_07575 [Candidatus Omnitrophota bacterium]
MKKNLVLVLTTIFALACAASLALTGCGKQQDVVIEELEEGGTQAVVKEFKTFNVYTDKRSPNNHYIASGWMGDHGDIKFNDMCMENPHSGTTCIKIEHLPRRSQGAGWIGVYWQNPANNWGSKKAGFDLTGAKKLTFWARGEKGTEIISEFKMGGITGEFSDTASAGIGPATLTQEWKQYEIDLIGQDLSHIIGGFCFSTNADDNPDGVVFYLDDIMYE